MPCPIQQPESALSVNCGDLICDPSQIKSVEYLTPEFHNAIGGERHCVFDCPHFQCLRQQHAKILQDSHDAMRSLMWHNDRKSVCALVLAIVNEAQTA